MSYEPDRPLVREVAEGDQGAFAALFEAHHREVYRIGQAIAGDHELAKDVVQETFLKVFRGMSGWRGAASLKTWIFRIAVRTAIDQRRRARRYSQLSSVSAEPSHDPRARMDAALALQRLQELAEGLPGQQGLILRLRLLGDLKNTEIAEILGLTPANVRMQCSKAVRRLRAML